MSELRHLSSKCSTCHAEVVLDLIATAQPENKRKATENLIPFECPACDTRFDTKVQKGIDQFRNSYRFLSNPELTGTQISLTITAPEN